MQVVFWSEFPDKVDWQLTTQYLADAKLQLEVYIACRTNHEFESWGRKIPQSHISLSVWPVLSKENGYWFSGYVSKAAIRKLRQFKGARIKVDLEPPIPDWSYRFTRILTYGIRLIFMRPKHTAYLYKEIAKLATDNHVEQVLTQSTVIANEFPVWRWYLKRYGLYMPPAPGVTKNIMCYTTPIPSWLLPLYRKYLQYMMRIALKRDEDTMFSIGLLAPGIFGNEPSYQNMHDFQHDLDLVKRMGAKKVAIYSLEGLLSREHPEQWLQLIKHYVN